LKGMYRGRGGSKRSRGEYLIWSVMIRILYLDRAPKCEIPVREKGRRRFNLVGLEIFLLLFAGIIGDRSLMGHNLRIIRRWKGI
jgi:hypothetical protein